MATLAVLPTDPLEFSEVIAFFGRDNPALAAGNFPPRGGFALTGFSEVTPTPTKHTQHLSLIHI